MHLLNEEYHFLAEEIFLKFEMLYTFYHKRGQTFVEESLMEIRYRAKIERYHNPSVVTPR